MCTHLKCSHKHADAPVKRTGNPDEAVYGLNHFMGVSDPFAGTGVEQAEGEWRSPSLMRTLKITSLVHGACTLRMSITPSRWRLSGGS